MKTVCCRKYEAVIESCKICWSTCGFCFLPADENVKVLLVADFEKQAWAWRCLEWLQEPRISTCPPHWEIWTKKLRSNRTKPAPDSKTDRSVFWNETLFVLLFLLSNVFGRGQISGHNEHPFAYLPFYHGLIFIAKNDMLLSDKQLNEPWTRKLCLISRSVKFI